MKLIGNAEAKVVKVLPFVVFCALPWWAQMALLLVGGYALYRKYAR
jgi:hypothetical protein